jgi:hypothetical protein
VTPKATCDPLQPAGEPVRIYLKRLGALTETIGAGRDTPGALPRQKGE